MRKIALVGIVGAAVAAGGFAGLANASDDYVLARLTIESADPGFAVDAARAIDISAFAAAAVAEQESEVAAVVLPQVEPVVAPEVAALPVIQPLPQPPVLDTEPTGTVETAVVVMPGLKPDFESTRSVTVDEPAVKRVAPRNDVVRVVERKRKVTLPIPVIIGAFR